MATRFNSSEIQRNCLKQATNAVKLFSKCKKVHVGLQYERHDNAREQRHIKGVPKKGQSNFGML